MDWGYGIGQNGWRPGLTNRDWGVRRSHIVILSDFVRTQLCRSISPAAHSTRCFSWVSGAELSNGFDGPFPRFLSLRVDRFVRHRLFWRRDMELCMIGLGLAGKTSLVNLLSTGDFKENVIPTVRLLLSTLVTSNSSISSGRFQHAQSSTWRNSDESLGSGWTGTWSSASSG